MNSAELIRKTFGVRNGFRVFGRAAGASGVATGCDCGTTGTIGVNIGKDVGKDLDLMRWRGSWCLEVFCMQTSELGSLALMAGAADEDRGAPGAWVRSDRHNKDEG